MRMYDVIEKKRDGRELTESEIQYVIQHYTNGEIPDYQMSALLMAIFIRGMNKKETIALTMAMAESGDQLDLSSIQGKKADKHSTGGVGDKTTLVLSPMLAALGVPVAKMSGRGLGHTGGTIDKLESIPNFSTTLPEHTFIQNVNEMKLALVGQTAHLAPADKKIYGLRDVTATVDNISLIAASIMSKKIAAGADVIVLDVKVGSGAFMKNIEDARKLASLMVEIGNGVGRKTVAVLSDMNQPLGNAVGNALEVIEAVETLKGKGSKEVLKLSTVLASHMLVGVGKAENYENASKSLLETIENKQAIHKFEEFVARQGGDVSYIKDTSKMKLGALTRDLVAKEGGYIQSFQTSEVGVAALLLGGGRETKESEIDLSVGIRLHKKIGDKVEKGERIATLSANEAQRLEAASERMEQAYGMSKEAVEPPKLIKEIIE